MENDVFVVSVEALIDASVLKVWEMWNSPLHIINWHHASNDWHAPHATNDFKIGSKFLIRMEAKDGSFGFDFSGTYTDIVTNEKIDFILDDGRKVQILFKVDALGVNIIESFEAENEYPLELQQNGWQAILSNFKSYVESN